MLITFSCLFRVYTLFTNFYVYVVNSCHFQSTREILNITN